ncbi:MAG: 3-isopropylmalate dehydratase small subunit [Candidatus Bathyarchaeia archaeon]|nr:3-isopropylmalate dehydratase small subunit [Candidatus Bathyarchaeota archaeon]
MKISGIVLKFGNNIDTDVILPGKYLVLTDPEELAKHAMEGLDKEFSEKAKKGVVIVAGENFGCGSSREHAPIALKYAGVKAIIAKSFARIFYRNAINIGLPVLECEDAYEKIEENNELLIDLSSGEIIDKTKNLTFKFIPLPSFLLNILTHGGLIKSLKSSLMQKSS